MGGASSRNAKVNCVEQAPPAQLAVKPPTFVSIKPAQAIHRCVLTFSHYSCFHDAHATHIKITSSANHLRSELNIIKTIPSETKLSSVYNLPMCIILRVT